jgi:hypothetical protein
MAEDKRKVWIDQRFKFAERQKCNAAGMQHKRFRQPLMVQHNAQMRIIIVGGELYSLEKKKTPPPPSKIVKFMLRREAQYSSWNGRLRRRCRGSEFRKLTVTPSVVIIVAAVVAGRVD